MTPKKLFIVAASSGGHMLPALECAKQWLEQNSKGQVFFFTGTSPLEKKIAMNQAFLHKILYCNIPKFSLRRWWIFPWLCIQSVLIFVKAFIYAIWYKPERVISTGGLLSIPVCIAARLALRPVHIYELNVLPGKAVKALLPFASVIHIVFQQTADLCKWGHIDFSKTCMLTPYPLRFSNKDIVMDKSLIIVRINKLLQQRNIDQKFDTTRKTLFVLGGSQGSLLLNNLLKDFIETNPELVKHLQIIHQTGSFDEASWYTWYAAHQLPAFTFSYDERINEFYQLADLIICRAGAGTLFEIAFFNKQCLVIPLVTQTTDHQIYNAQAMASLHPDLFTIIQQQDITENPKPFFDKTRDILMIYEKSRKIATSI